MVGVITLVILLLGTILVLATKRMIAKATAETDKIVNLALEQGYQEGNLTPLTVAVSPFGERYRTGMAGAPILA